MSTLAISAPLPIPAFRREYQWEHIRSAPLPLSRLDSNNTLPSIRELIPDHLLNSHPKETPASRGGLVTSPTTVTPASQISPAYVHTPHGAQKRRRLSAEADHDHDHERARQVPRLYQPAEHSPYARRDSPTRPDGYFSEPQQRPVTSAGGHREALERADPRQSAPGLPPPQPAPKRVFERDGGSEYRHEVHPDAYHGRPSPGPHVRTLSVEQQTTSYRNSHASDYAFSGYQSSARFTAATNGSTHGYERTPFTTPPYGSQYSDYARYGADMGHGVLGGEAKQRKRRGNLPKETTDKLRAWFVAHLQHPYPTEDEKQELMRQTGLQMNQISNWFINARRRQLPTMINDARAESDVMNGRALAKADGVSYEDGGRDHHSLTDGESRHYDEELQTRRNDVMKRESI